MLEQLRIWGYRVMESRGDNPSSAANQQESLSAHEKKCWFLAGLIEGEGSLCISIKKHESFKFGYLVQPEFFIYQHQVRRGLLELAQEVFDTGKIRPKPGNEVVLVYSITNRRLILERVLPFFERYMAFSLKGHDFQLFREVVIAMEQKRHRDPLELVSMDSPLELTVLIKSNQLTLERLFLDDIGNRQRESPFSANKWQRTNGE